MELRDESCVSLQLPVKKTGLFLFFLFLFFFISVWKQNEARVCVRAGNSVIRTFF